MMCKARCITLYYELKKMDKPTNTELSIIVFITIYGLFFIAVITSNDYKLFYSILFLDLMLSLLGIIFNNITFNSLGLTSTTFYLVNLILKISEFNITFITDIFVLSLCILLIFRLKTKLKLTIAWSFLHSCIFVGYTKIIDPATYFIMKDDMFQLIVIFLSGVIASLANLLVKIARERITIKAKRKFK